MFACYRRDDAYNPEIYCAAVASVLSEYSIGVVDYVTDPRTGLPSEEKFLPNVAEIREACNRRAEQARRLAEKPVFRETRPYIRNNTPGRRANVFVHADAPQYNRCLELSKKADLADWKLDPQGRPGIWIALSLFDGATRPKMQTWKSPTDNELRAAYSRNAPQSAIDDRGDDFLDDRTDFAG